jgi:hypothetical protein
MYELEKQEKTFVANRGSAYGVIGTTRCLVGPQNHNHFHNKASMQNTGQAKPNQTNGYYTSM